MSKAAAIARATRFAATKDERQEAFPNIKTTRRLFGSSLVHRVNTPWAISQATSSLCGPASLMYMLLHKRPDIYVQYAIDLYTTGKASIGRIQVDPGDGCRRSTASGMAPVDWTTLASLRDSSNDLLAYDSPSDELAGITLPGSLTGWLERSGLFTDITSNTSLVFDQGMSELVRANNAFASGKLVAFFVGANLFGGETGGSMFPDHWIMLASPIRVGGAPLPATWPKHYIKMRHPVRTKPAVQNRRVVNPEYRKARDAVLDKHIQFTFFSWGRLRTLPTGTTVESLLDYFYGYVTAR